MSRLGYVKCCKLIGNGDFRKGKKLFTDWALRMAHAREEHPVFAEGRFHALGVISDEFREFEHAVEHETPERMVDEALDEMATLARFILGEHETEAEVQKAMKISISDMLQ